MNNYIASGYIQDNAEYIKHKNGIGEYRFYIAVFSQELHKALPIPCKAMGTLADKCAISLNPGYYVEVSGELVRESATTMYIVIHEMSYKKPKGANQYYIRVSEFIEAFNPKDIIQQLKEDNSVDKT